MGTSPILDPLDTPTNLPGISFAQNSTAIQGIRTSFANETVLFFVGMCNTTAGFHVSSITGGGLTFTKRAAVNDFPVNTTTNTTFLGFELWWANAPTPLGLTAITITLNSATTAGSNIAVIITGAFNTAAPFDDNPSLTAQNTYSNASNSTLPTITFSTNETDNLLIFASCQNTQSFATAPPLGWSLITIGGTNAIPPSAVFTAADFLSINSPQSGLTITANTGPVYPYASNTWIAFADAITANPPTPPFVSRKQRYGGMTWSTG